MSFSIFQYHSFTLCACRLATFPGVVRACGIGSAGAILLCSGIWLAPFAVRRRIVCTSTYTPCVYPDQYTRTENFVSSRCHNAVSLLPAKPPIFYFEPELELTTNTLPPIQTRRALTTDGSFKLDIEDSLQQGESRGLAPPPPHVTNALFYYSYLHIDRFRQETIDNNSPPVL